MRASAGRGCARDRRTLSSRAARNRPQAAARRGGPVLSTQSLRRCWPPDAAAALAFGTSPDGTAIGPDDFATTGSASFTIDVPPGGNILEFQADAELGKDRNAVVRVMLSERPEGTSRDALQRVVFGDPQSAGYKTFRANMAEYVVAAAAELARRGESRRQGSGAGAVRQHLQQPRARCVRAEGEVPAQRQVLHREHGRRRRPRAAQSGVERSVRIVAVPRRVSRHAGRSLRPEARRAAGSPISTPRRSRRCPPRPGPISRRFRAHYDEVTQGAGARRSPATSPTR